MRVTEYESSDAADARQKGEKRMGLGSGMQGDTYGRVISNRSSISSDEIQNCGKRAKNPIDLLRRPLTSY